MKKTNNVQLRNFISDPSEGMKDGDVVERCFEDLCLKEIEICLSDEKSVFVYMGIVTMKDGSLSTALYGKVLENGWKEIGPTVRDRDVMKFYKRKWPKFHALLRNGQRGNCSENMLCGSGDDMVLVRCMDIEKLNGNGGDKYMQQLVLQMLDAINAITNEMTNKPFTKGDTGRIWLDAVCQSFKRTKWILWFLGSGYGSPGI